MDTSSEKIGREESLNGLRKRIEHIIATHDTWTDPIFFNGLSMGTIALSAIVSVVIALPTLSQTQKIVASSLSAAAGVFVAVERALGFGARWRYHREMRSSYEQIIDMIDFYPLLPDPEKPKYLKDIFAALYAVRSRESAIPNAGTSSSS